MHNRILRMLICLSCGLTACSLYQSPDRKRLAEQGQAALLSNSLIVVSCHITPTGPMPNQQERENLSVEHGRSGVEVQFDLNTPAHSALCRSHYPDQYTFHLRWAEDRRTIKEYIEASLTYGQLELEFILN